MAIITNVSNPTIINTSEVSNIVGQYLTDDVTLKVPEILKRVNTAISFGCTDERVSLLTPDAVFNGLGEDAWKDIIDGKHHGLGPMVFDKDRPDHPGEPGFYQGIKNACEMTSKLLFEPSSITTVATYKRIHLCACAHFTGTGDRKGGDGTLVHGSMAGKFMRLPFKSCFGSYQDLFINNPSIATRIVDSTKRWSALRTANRSWLGMPTNEMIAICAKNGIIWNYHSLSPQEQIDIRLKYKISDEWLLDNDNLDKLIRYELSDRSQELETQEEKKWKDEFGPMVQAKIEELNADMEKRSAALDITDTDGKPLQFAYIMDTGRGVRIGYTCPSELIETVVERIFEHFRRDVSAASSKIEIRRCIANLYQMLEWVHAFPDGQGRTDLIMLKTLLTAYGLTPAILDEPYVSTFCPLDVWDTYLAHGMEKWKLEYSSKKA